MGDKKTVFDVVVDVTIRLGFLLLLIGWCLSILAPFIMPVIWGVVIAVAIEPIYLFFLRKLKGKSKWAGLSVVVLLLSVVFVPSGIFIESLMDGVLLFKAQFSKEVVELPLPNEKIKVIPLIGEQLYNFWGDLHDDLKGVVMKYNEEIKAFGLQCITGVMSVGGMLFQMVFSIIIAGVLLATKGTDDLSIKFFGKIVGERAKEFVELSIATIQNVTKGVLGVAIIQGFLFGVGFVIAGVPYAGLWAVIGVILAVVQVPLILVVLPVSVYLYNVDTVLVASLWSVYFVLVSLVDNILKPLILGNGSVVPMLVVFLGSLGGFVMSGFLGLFTGAIVLSLGFKLFIAWLNDGEKVENRTS